MDADAHTPEHTHTVTIDATNIKPIILLYYTLHQDWGVKQW